MEPGSSSTNLNIGQESTTANQGSTSLAAEFDKATLTASLSETPLSTAEAAPRSFLSLLNLSIGFFGIQFAWMIQIMRTTPFLESLGSNPFLSGLIWWAGPITGILVQPIVGSLSDKTRTALGRRRPFLIAGMLSTALWLVLMPNAPTLLVAALLLWVLDASINISQGPYRALVPDVVPKSQQAQTFAMMSFFIGMGSVAASYIGTQVTSMTSLFYIGAVVMLVFMTWTMLTTSEPKLPPTSDAVLSSDTPRSSGSLFSHTLNSILSMPREAQKLCVVHSLTWFGWQCLFIFFSVFVVHQLYHVTTAGTPEYEAGLQFASLCFLMWNIVTVFASAIMTPALKIIPRKVVHTIGLALMAIGLLSMGIITLPWHAAIAMTLLGVGWASTLSIPFAMMANNIPPGKEGVMMGTFNIFIAAPQIFASALAGLLVSVTGLDSSALVLGGVSVLLAAIGLQTIDDRAHNTPTTDLIAGQAGH